MNGTAVVETNGKAHAKSHSAGENSVVPFSLNRELWQQRFVKYTFSSVIY